MSEHDDWQASQHRDECMRLQQIDEILAAAELRALEPHEIRILAAEAGTQYPIHKPT